MKRLIEEKRLCVFVGEGGVGKTSCAAATSVTAALRGRRAACERCPEVGAVAARADRNRER